MSTTTERRCEVCGYPADEFGCYSPALRGAYAGIAYTESDLLAERAEARRYLQTTHDHEGATQ